MNTVSPILVCSNPASRWDWLLRSSTRKTINGLLKTYVGPTCWYEYWTEQEMKTINWSEKTKGDRLLWYLKQTGPLKTIRIKLGLFSECTSNCTTHVFDLLLLSYVLSPSSSSQDRENDKLESLYDLVMTWGWHPLSRQNFWLRLSQHLRPVYGNCWNRNQLTGLVAQEVLKVMILCV